MNSPEITDDEPLYWPCFFVGGATVLLFLWLFGQSKFNGLLLVELGFFLLGASVAFTFAPNHPILATWALLGGVFVGVMVDAFIHPVTAESFERNLFPVEAAIQTLFALPVTLIAAIAWAAISERRKSRSGEQ